MNQETKRSLTDYLMNRHGYDYLTATTTAEDLKEWYDDNVGWDTDELPSKQEVAMFDERIEELENALLDIQHSVDEKVSRVGL